MNEIKFVDEEHKQFWNEKYEKMQHIGKTDAYYKSIVYILGICKTTRENFNKIFNLKNGEININSINDAYQTNTSQKVTRMAFSLWNGCNYDSEKDAENKKFSSYYNISEIFSCIYAPYFYEGIKLRYPEYTREMQNNPAKSHIIQEDIQDDSKDKIGIYARGNESSVKKQIEQAHIYCNKNEIENKIIYADIGFSSRNENRPSYNKLIDAVCKKEITKVIITSPEKINRNMIDLIEFIEICKRNEVKVISLDGTDLQEDKEIEKILYTEQYKEETEEEMNL